MGACPAKAVAWRLLGLGRCVLAGVCRVHAAASRVLAHAARTHHKRAACAKLAGVFAECWQCAGKVLAKCSRAASWACVHCHGLRVLARCVVRNWCVLCHVRACKSAGGSCCVGMYSAVCIKTPSGSIVAQVQCHPGVRMEACPVDCTQCMLAQAGAREKAGVAACGSLASERVCSGAEKSSFSMGGEGSFFYFTAVGYRRCECAPVVGGSAHGIGQGEPTSWL